MRSSRLTLGAWPLLLTAPLLGLSQSILIVYTPLLVEMTQLSLAQLASIMTLGSALFLISTPFWGRRTRRQGIKKVLYQGVYGFSISFALILALLCLMQHLDLSPAWIIGSLVFARIIYGLTAAAIVPGCQACMADLSDNAAKAAAGAIQVGHSAASIADSDENASRQSMKHLGQLSAAMAMGRLIAPSLALGLIWLDTLAPIILLTALPLLCIAAIWRYLPQPKDRIASHETPLLNKVSQAANGHLEPQLPQPKDRIASLLDKVSQEAISDLKPQTLQTNDTLSLVAMALMCASYSVFCYLLTPISQEWLMLDATQASQFISVLMSLSAASMLLSHTLLSHWFIRTHLAVILCFCLLMLGAIALTAQNLTWGLYLAIPIISMAFATSQLRVLSRICDRLNQQNKVLATSALAQYQTLGYIVGAGVLSLTQSHILLTLAVIALMTLGKILLFLLILYRERHSNILL